MKQLTVEVFVSDRFRVIALTNLGLYFDREQKCNGNCHKTVLDLSNERSKAIPRVNAKSNHEGS